MLKKFLKDINSRMIYRVQAAHVLRSIALSFVSVYVPAFLLTHGYSLRETIFFYVILHGVGLLSVFVLIVPLLRRFGMVRTLRLHYPLQVFFLVLLFLGNGNSLSVWLAAAIGGIANMIYWVPLNILFIRYTDRDAIAKDFSLFFALPSIFGIFGPLLGALLVVTVGYAGNFTIAFFGLLLSALPLRALENDEHVDLRLSQAIPHLRRRKLLFFLEGFDNIIEESEWFWGILVFLLIGSLATPGIVGALESLGSAAFMILVGRYINDKKGTLLIQFVSIILLILVWAARFFIATPLPAYLVTIASSFVMTLFLISYFSIIYRKVKGDQDAEFIILREIPTVLGRMIVFAVAILTISDIQKFFYLPIIAMIVLLITMQLAKRSLLLRTPAE